MNLNPNELDKLLMLEASVNYTILHFTDGESQIYSYTLKRFEQQLALNDSFVRIHKSFIVNRAFIQEVRKREVVLLSDKVLPLARRRRV
ncbi:MAG: LytR/AlgR family response regulator transcription factor [Spirosomataceae bacterium]